MILRISSIQDDNLNEDLALILVQHIPSTPLEIFSYFTCIYNAFFVKKKCLL
ncbi:hypothetical protein X975_17283, partial [Stegodyphus mimosarum]